MPKLLIATGNKGKVEEYRELLKGILFDLVTPRDVGITMNVEETGDTLEENARLKARALCEATGLAAVADDTGLEVDALDGAPGVYSARFAGEDATYGDNVAKMLDEPLPTIASRYRRALERLKLSMAKLV